jgi:hypothetical protein
LMPARSLHRRVEAMLAMYPGKGRSEVRRILKAQDKPRTVDPITAAEMAIEERETAPVRNIPAWKGRELWCTGVTPDGRHYEGKVEDAPRNLVVDSYTAKEVVFRPATSYRQRRGLTWLAQLAKSGALDPAEAAAAVRWRDDWQGSSCMPGSILDPDRTYGGSDGIPHTRLLTAAACAESYTKASAALRGASSEVLRACRAVFVEDKSPEWVAETRALLPKEVKAILKRGAAMLAKHYGSGRT